MKASSQPGAAGLAERAVAGDARALARIISLIEDDDPQAVEVVRLLYPRVRGAYRVGFTGPPGVGKSTLISSLVSVCRADGLSVGVITVDPTSPFSRGALLGDRIRLADHFLDPGVFIRSMGSRGHLGGLAAATLQVTLVLDAVGKDVIFVETVGVGQSEVEIVSLADTVVLSLMPGSGDSVQALKAGVMEIPDVIVVNKRDHPGADAMLHDVRTVLALAEGPAPWEPPLLGTDALTGRGVPELWAAILAHKRHLEEGGVLEERREGQVEREILSLAADRLKRRLLAAAADDSALAGILDRVRRRELDPLSAVAAVCDRVDELWAGGGIRWATGEGAGGGAGAGHAGGENGEGGGRSGEKPGSIMPATEPSDRAHVNTAEQPEP